MRSYYKKFAYAGFVTLLSTTALAEDISMIKGMDDDSSVSVTGTVEKISNEREFLLRNATDTIDVDIAADQSVVLKQGDSVTVSGILDKDFFGTDIDATQVMVHKNVAQALGDSIEGNTTISFEGAESYDIGNLPSEGLVKVFGTVTDVDNEKEFTLKDASGSINVDIKSAESAALSEGANVTVVGYVDKNVIGKDIKAKKVIVVEPASGKKNY